MFAMFLLVSNFCELSSATPAPLSQFKAILLNNQHSLAFPRSAHYPLSLYECRARFPSSGGKNKAHNTRWNVLSRLKLPLIDGAVRLQGCCKTPDCSFSIYPQAFLIIKPMMEAYWILWMTICDMVLKFGVPIPTQLNCCDLNTVFL